MENEIAEIMLMAGNVPNLDEWVLEFVKLNFITVGLILGILKILVPGNKIITFLLEKLPKKK